MALVSAGHVKQEDVNGVLGFLHGLMSADEVTPAEFGASLKNAVAGMVEPGKDVDAELGMHLRMLEQMVMAAPPQAGLPPQPTREDEIAATLKRVLEMFDHVDNDGKIHFWEFEMMMKNGYQYGLYENETLEFALGWF